MSLTAHRTLHEFNKRFYSEPDEDGNVWRGVINGIALSIPLWALIVWAVV